MYDNRDIQILEILQNNGRSTASDIAKEVNLSIPAVGERIKKLTEKGLIERFVAILNHKNAGLDLTAYVFIVSEHSDSYKQFVGSNCTYLRKTEEQAKKIFSLPMYPTLTDEEQGIVIQELKKLIK